MTNFLQINLHRCWGAEQLLDQTVVQRNVDVIIASEFPDRCLRGDRWCISTDRKAAVATTAGSSLAHVSKGSGTGFAWMEFSGFYVVSCYWSPGSTLQEYSTFLDDLGDVVRNFGGRSVVVAGDFNAWNVEWGSTTNYPRGELLSDFAASTGLILANRGSVPTFVRGTASSIIDVTYYKGIVIKDWTVLDEENLSDHAYISYIVDTNVATADPALAITRGWAIKKMNHIALESYVRNNPIFGDFAVETADGYADVFDEYIAKACDASMPPRTRSPLDKRPVYWWSDQIADMRKTVFSYRRAYQKCLRRNGAAASAVKKAQFTKAKRDLRLEIRRAKEKAWNDLCTQVDIDPWGKPYKIVMKKLGNTRIKTAAKGREKPIAEHLFPAAPFTDWDAAPSPAVIDLFADLDIVEGVGLRVGDDLPEFTEDELLKAIKRLSPGKAGGPSGIPNEVLRRIAIMRPRSVLMVYNACLRARKFPKCWKRALLVLLHKGADKPVTEPSSFRPICLLDSPGKLLERLLLQRLEEHLDAFGGCRRAPNQFGFRKGQSTESAVEVVTNIAARAAAAGDLCVLVTLDVKNAFNSLRWPIIDEALRKKKTPEYLVRTIRSWLSDRSLLIGEERARHSVTCGVPQGSVLGPTLWNIAYDDLLCSNVPPGINLIGFADDLAVVGVAHTGPLLEEIMNPTLESIDRWMTSHNLSLAHHKSEAVMLTKKLKYTAPALAIGGHRIIISKSIRYLGVFLDTRLSFGIHAETVAKKAAHSAIALSKLMPNTKGPQQKKRKLLCGVVDSQLLYAANIWANALSTTAKYRKIMLRPQRTVALRVVRAYRTVSTEAALLLADMPPVDLLALERSRIKRRLAEGPPPGQPLVSKASIKREERRATLRLWNGQWIRSTKADWTHRLIPDVRRWMNRTVPRVGLSFHMTQALSGHGCFQEYLHRMGRAPSPRCVHCPCRRDTAEHTLLECPRWQDSRSELMETLGHPPTWKDVADLITGPVREDLPVDHEGRIRALTDAEESFKILYRMVEKILTLKEEEERRRQESEERQPTAT